MLTLVLWLIAAYLVINAVWFGFLSLIHMANSIIDRRYAARARSLSEMRCLGKVSR